MSRPSPIRSSPAGLPRSPPSTRANARPTCSATSPSICSPYRPRMSYALKISCGTVAGMAVEDRLPPAIAAQMTPTTLHTLLVFLGPGGAGGNPLGVVLDGGDVPPAERQAVAADLGFSETVFVD